MRLSLMLSFLAASVLTGSWSDAVLPAVVGRYLQVQGQVEVLRAGKTTASVKVGDGVEPWDVIRTRSGSRVQVRFEDDSLVTVAPGSSIVIQEFLSDAPRGERRAMLQVSRGLAFFAINRNLNAAQPDFIVKTHTAMLGVRDTRFFVLPGSDFTCAFNEVGLFEASNIVPSLTKKTVVQGYGVLLHQSRHGTHAAHKAHPEAA